MEPTEIEQTATSQGWRPQEEFKGDPADWKSAEEFVEHGEKIHQVMKERNGKLLDEMQDLKSQLSEQKATMDSFVKFSKNAEERAYNKAVSDLKGKQIEAVKDGDEAAYKAIDKEIDDLEKPQQTPQANPAEIQMKVFNEWAGANEWYGDVENVEQIIFADKVFDILAAKTKPATEAEFNKIFDAVTTKVKTKFSKLFENGNRNKPAAVVGGDPSQQTKVNGGKSNYANLPAEAKTQCDSFVKQFNPTGAKDGYSKEDYVKQYDWGV